MSSKRLKQEKGLPQSQYKIPYISKKSDDINSYWYVILTTTNVHFYFNSQSKEAYWQLGDFRHLFEDDEWETFISAFEFNELSLLFARNIGFNWIRNEKKIDEDEAIQHVEISQEDELDINDIDETVDSEHEREVVDEVVVDEDLVRDILREGGYLNKTGSAGAEDDPNISSPESQSPKPLVQSGGIGISLGYSSSEEDDEDDDEEEEKEEEEEEKGPEQNHEAEEDSNINEGLDLSVDDHEENSDLNVGLDLSIDDQEELEQNDDFIKLLDTFKSRISVYDSWALVEEELISEFVKYPEYYSIEDGKAREQIFNNWIIERQKEESALDVDEDSGNEVDEDSEVDSEQEIYSEKYPTPTLEYFKLLQQYKKEIKSLVYQQFYNSHFKEINSIALSSKEKDSIYRSFKTMLTNQTQFEKSYKKEHPDSKINLKKLKLDEYLQTCIEHFKDHIEEIKTFLTLNPGFATNITEEEAFSTWIKLINNTNIGEQVAENNINFVVGDVKRVQSYIELYNSII
ncbi:uncharacterized protein RJT21DRAFT_117830 [Scheffersomyces amazonensis]|uniref:uncharacterized protein n=1 Tax=Scheffersomyces amazonensis TaxID=1078765 RepID=UPI00315DFC12